MNCPFIRDFQISQVKRPAAFPANPACRDPGIHHQVAKLEARSSPHRSSIRCSESFKGQVVGGVIAHRWDYSFGTKYQV